MAVIYVLGPVVLLLLGFPIFALLLATALVALFMSGTTLDVMQTLLFGGLDSYPLLAIPFFILAGEIIGQGGIANRLIAWVTAVIGGVRGSLALTAVASSELFGAMSGSSVACVAAVGRLLFPALRDNGYGERFGSSLVAASGAIAIVIPPSIAIIIYGVAAQESVTILFAAGILPAILIGVLDASYVFTYAKITRVPVTGGTNWRKIVTATREAVWALGAPLVIFGGIYGGIFTPTEAAGVAVLYSLFVSKYVYRAVTWADLWRIAVSATSLSAQILIIVAAAGVYSWFLTTSGLPQALVGVVGKLHLSAFQTLMLFNVVLLVIGSVLEPPAAILILTPLLLPIVEAFGINRIHFGIIVAVNLSIGMYTPPLGLNLLASHSLFGVPLGTLYRGVLPFVVINLVALIIITYVPQISLAFVR